MYLGKFVDLNSINNVQQLVAHTVDLKRKAIAILVADALLEWRTFVKEQLAKGGGKLFAYIAQQNKEFLCVTLDDLPGKSLSPNRLLSTEFDAWASFWGCPTSGQEDAENVSANLKHFREYALDQVSEPLGFSQSSLDKALARYKSNGPEGPIIEAPQN